MTAHIILPDKRFDIWDIPAETTLREVLSEVGFSDFKFEKFQVFLGGARADSWHLSQPVKDGTYVEIARRIIF